MSRDTVVSTIISERFSQFDRYLDALFKRDENFRCLCNDFQQSLQALDRWSVDKSSVGELRQQEYAELAKELEQEIRNCLEQFRHGEG